MKPGKNTGIRCSPLAFRDENELPVLTVTPSAHRRSAHESKFPHKVLEVEEDWGA